VHHLFFTVSFEDFALAKGGALRRFSPLADAVEIEKNQNPHRKEPWLYRRIQGYTTGLKYVNRILSRLTMCCDPNLIRFASVRVKPVIHLE
jgi:hypothetical protein